MKGVYVGEILCLDCLKSWTKFLLPNIAEYQANAMNIQGSCPRCKKTKYVYEVASLNIIISNERKEKMSTGNVIYVQQRDDAFYVWLAFVSDENSEPPSNARLFSFETFGSENKAYQQALVDAHALAHQKGEVKYGVEVLKPCWLKATTRVGDRFSLVDGVSGKVFHIVGACKASPSGLCCLASLEYGWSYTGKMVHVGNAHNITAEEFKEMAGSHQFIKIADHRKEGGR